MANVIPDHIWQKRRLKQLQQFRILRQGTLNRYDFAYQEQGCDQLLNNRHGGSLQSLSLVYYDCYDAVFLVGETSLYKIKPGPPHQWRDSQAYTKEIADCTILEPGSDAAGLIISNQSCTQRVICVSEGAIVGKDKLVWIDISRPKYDEYFFQFVSEKLVQVQGELNDIREKLDILWHAPGMPGTLASQRTFEQNSMSMAGTVTGRANSETVSRFVADMWKETSTEIDENI